MSRTTLSRRARTTGALTLALAAAWPVADRAAAAPVALTGLQYECAVLDPEDPEAEPLPLADRWVLDLTADLPATVQQGSTMPAPEITTKITVGDDAADLLREGGVTTADAGGSLHLYTVGSTELLAITDLDGTVRLPRDGAATVRTTGEGEELKVTQRPGTLTVAVGPMLVSLGKEGDVGMDVACEPVAGQRLTLGRITVVAAPTPTPTPTPTSTPTATPAPTSTPVPTTPAPAPTGPVVQADWVPTAQDEHRHGHDEQLLLAGAALAAAGGGALVRRRRSDHTG